MHADPLFRDRDDAGTRLASRLPLATLADPVVVGIARGGAVIAAAVVSRTPACWDVVVARKIAAPARPEHALAAVTRDGAPIYHDAALAALGLSPGRLRADIERELAQAHRQDRLYHHVRPPMPLRNRDVALVDDGLATGLTACRAPSDHAHSCSPRRSAHLKEKPHYAVTHRPTR
jgi:predicted phosphoribosyltransferase